ncbi:MAG: hypothetical protein AB7E80_07065 [Hyphomicrobiaceae bacterium]
MISKTIMAAALACSLALAGATGASAAGTGALAGLKGADTHSTVIDVRGRGARNVALGVLGAAAAVAIISGAARAERRGYRHSDRCDYYDYKCSQGYGWACRKFDNRCDY